LFALFSIFPFPLHSKWLALQVTFCYTGHQLRLDSGWPASSIPQLFTLMLHDNSTEAQIK
jgi:hypothetical protein